MLTLKRAALMLSLAAAALTLLSMAASLEPANAATGNTTTAVALGLKYENGHGVPKNYAKALHYFRLAAAQGSAARFLTVIEPYEDQPAVKSAEALSADKLRVELADGRVQEIEIKNIEGDGKNIQVNLTETRDGKILRQESTTQ